LLEFMVDINRAIIKQAMKDFASSEPRKRAEVASWLSANKYIDVCIDANIDPDYLALFFLEMSEHDDLDLRKKLVGDAISTMDSFAIDEEKTSISIN